MRHWSASGRATAPETIRPKLDSRKTAIDVSAARRPTDRLEAATPHRSMRLTNPSIPPDACVSVIIAPIRALNSRTRALSPSVADSR